MKWLMYMDKLNGCSSFIRQRLLPDWLLTVDKPGDVQIWLAKDNIAPRRMDSHQSHFYLGKEVDLTP
jgi:hypothetical protein